MSGPEETCWCLLNSDTTRKIWHFLLSRQDCTEFSFGPAINTTFLLTLTIFHICWCQNFYQIFCVYKLFSCRISLETHLSTYPNSSILKLKYYLCDWNSQVSLKIINTSIWIKLRFIHSSVPKLKSKKKSLNLSLSIPFLWLMWFNNYIMLVMPSIGIRFLYYYFFLMSYVGMELLFDQGAIAPPWILGKNFYRYI